MSNKMDLIKKASEKAPLKRVKKDIAKEVPLTKMIRQNQSFSITEDIVDLIGSFKKGALSKAVKTALLLADEKGLLDEYKNEVN